MTGRKAKLPPKESWLETDFLFLWKEFASALPEPEHHYCYSTSRKHVDFAWPTLWVAVEMEGGGKKTGKDGQRGGRHHREPGYTNDCQKYNGLTMAGWRLLRYTAIDMKERPIQVIEEVAEFVRQRLEVTQDP
jgi:very-short-patch-repair endonuclease